MVRVDEENEQEKGGYQDDSKPCLRWNEEERKELQPGKSDSLIERKVAYMTGCHHSPAAPIQRQEDMFRADLFLTNAGTGMERPRAKEDENPPGQKNHE